jgi:hypothetical protein
VVRTRKPKGYGPVRFGNDGTVASQRYQRCKNAEHVENLWKSFSQFLKKTAGPLTFFNTTNYVIDFDIDNLIEDEMFYKVLATIWKESGLVRDV